MKFVLYQDKECEVINERSNYLTLLHEGKEVRIWRSDAVFVEGKSKRNQLLKESLIYKGYKTRNFNRDLSEKFKSLVEDIEDSYGMLNYIKSIDDLLDVNEETREQDYLGVQETIDRIGK